jgi:hypothetical protein
MAVTRKFGKRGVNVEPIPHFPIVDAAWLRHPTIRDELIELGGRDPDVTSGGFALQTAWDKYRQLPS